MSGTGAPGARQTAGELSLDQSGDRRRAGEDDALHAGIRDDRLADLACAGKKRKRLARRPGLVQDADRFGRDQRRLLRRLGDDRIARRERRGDLPGEDRQRKIPRADAGDDAERGRRTRAQRPRRLGGVIAQEVDRLAHFGDRIGVGLARLAHDEADEVVVRGFERVRGAAQDRRAFVRRHGGPRRRRLGRDPDRRRNVVRTGVASMADDIGVIGRIAHRLALFIRRSKRRERAPVRPRARFQPMREFGEPLLVGEIDAPRIDALGSVKVARQGDLLMRRARRLDLQREGDRIGDQLVDGNAGVGDAVDERSVGAVLEQAAHQIGEQRLMRADRRIDAARTIELVAADDFLVERLAHAVQALELVLAAVEARPRHGHDRSERLGVVGGELREDRVRRGEQLPRRSEIADVGVDLAGEDGEVFEPVHLRALDLRIPIGALDEANHQPPVRPPREVDEPVDDEKAALAVSLDDEAEAVPACEIGIERRAIPAYRATGRSGRPPRRRCSGRYRRIWRAPPGA